jgi:hypothetical protein
MHTWAMSASWMLPPRSSSTARANVVLTAAAVVGSTRRWSLDHAGQERGRGSGGLPEGPSKLGERPGQDDGRDAFACSQVWAGQRMMLAIRYQSRHERGGVHHRPSRSRSVPRCANVRQTAAIRSTSGMARSMLDEMLGFVDEYLDERVPLWMLERGVGGPEGDRLAPAACGGTVSTRRGPSQEPGATRRRHRPGRARLLGFAAHAA